MIATYLNELKSTRRLTEGTLKLYASALSILESMHGDRAEILRSLNRVRPATHASRLMIWKGYLKFMKDSLLEDIPMPIVRRKQISFLTEQEANRMRDYAEANLFSGEILFIDLALSLGLRLGEILNLTQKSIEGDWLLIKRKGEHEQRLPVPRRIRDQLANFQGFTKCRRYYQSLIARVAKACGIQKKVSPHTLRHTFATQKVAEGHSIVLIKEFLGHQSLNTTERYLHVTPENLKELIK